MPARRSTTDASRAEARRRARLAAQGREPLPEDDVAAPTAARSTGERAPTILGRFFPPAPPLPGKGDPLAGFTYSGRFGGIVSGAWLLVRHPLPWGAAGVGWAVLQLSLLMVGREDLLAFAITFGQYGLLIGAGWVGWWRPWLFGAAAGVSGVVFQTLLGMLITVQAGGNLAGSELLTSLALLLTLYGMVGAFAGFYGGYLRRRMATPAPNRKGRRR